jgi:hypothetical protein
MMCRYSIESIFIIISKRVVEVDRAYEINYEKIREEFPSLKVDCFIKKPIEIQDLVRRINAELK